jgi:hypothetical protein
MAGPERPVVTEGEGGDPARKHASATRTSITMSGTRLRLLMSVNLTRCELGPSPERSSPVPFESGCP